MSEHLYCGAARRRRCVAIVCAAAGIVACNVIAYGDNGASGQVEIVIKGSYAGKGVVGDLLEKWNMGGREVRGRFGAEGNNLCARMLVRRECDIVVRSSEWDYTDRQLLPRAFNRWPDEPRQYRLGVFGVAVVVNARNTLGGMLIRDVERIFTGEIKDWSGIAGAEIRGPVVACSPPLDTNESYIFRIRAMRRNAYGKTLTIIRAREALLSRIAEEPRAIGFVLMDPEEVKLRENTRLLAVVPSPRIKRTDQWRSLEELFPSKPGEPGFRWEAAIRPSKDTIYEGSYVLVDELSLYVHPEASPSAMRFCEYAVSRDASDILHKHCVFPEDERRQHVAARRLAEYTAGKGIRISAAGAGHGMMIGADLAIEYVKAKAVVQMGYGGTDSDVAAVGAFARAGAEATSMPVQAGGPSASTTPTSMPTTAPAVVATMTPFVAAGGKELLFLADKPSARAMELHGQKWNALGRDANGQPNGTGPAEYLLAGRAAAVVVNPANKIDALTIGQLQAIFGGEVADWGTLGNSGSQIKGSQIKPYGLRSDDLATGIFEKECLERAKWKRVGIKKDSAEVLAAVSMDPQAIGFVDLADIPATGQSVKILAIKLGMGERAKLILPTPENIKNAMYPLSQRLWLYVHPQASDTAKDFVKFIATCGASEASPYADTVKAVMDTYRKHGLVPLADAALLRMTKDAMAEAARSASSGQAAKAKAEEGKMFSCSASDF